MPERVMAAKRVAVFGGKRLHTLTSSQGAHTFSWLSGVPLAAVLGDNMVEESIEDICSPIRVRIIGIVCRAKVECLTLSRRNALKNSLEAESASRRISSRETVGTASDGEANAAAIRKRARALDIVSSDEEALSALLESGGVIRLWSTPLNTR